MRAGAAWREMRGLTNLTLGRKIALLTTLGLVLAVAAFGFVALRAVNQATEAMLQDRLTTARLVADYLDGILGRALGEIIQTAQEVSADSPNLEAETRSLTDIYEKLSISVHGIYYLDESGKVVWSRPQGTDDPDLSFKLAVQRSLQNGIGQISGMVLGPGDATPVILLSAPSGKGPGALVAAVNLAQSSIGGLVHPLQMGQTGYAEIVDQNGLVLVRTEPGPDLSPFEKSDHSGRFSELIAAGQPTRGLCHTCHEPVRRLERDVLAFVPLNQVKWGVAIRQSEDEALAPIYELRRNLLLFGGALIAVALLFVFVTTRDIVAQIRVLTAASRRIARGDLTVPIRAMRKDEIGVLGQTFEEMRLRLNNSYGELERRTSELTSLLSVADILTSLSGLSDLDRALGLALERTLEIFKTNVGGVLLLDEEKHALRYEVYRGLTERYTGEVFLRVGQGIEGIVAETGQSIRVDDITKDPRTAYLDQVTAEGLKAFACVPLRSKNRVLGVLDIASRDSTTFTAQDVRLLEGIASQIATAVENARLHREVQHKDEIRGELLRQILTIQEEERRRIARELHDETCQVLASLTANIEAALTLMPRNSEALVAQLKQAQGLSISALDELHRLIYQLRPSLLDDLGLVTAVRWLADNNLKPVGMSVSFQTIGRVRRLDPQLETTLFRVTQEAVYNIARHSGAKSAEIVLHFKRGSIEVRMTDDGVGFDVEEAISSKDRPRGLGLLGMKERIELVNGTISIRSRPGGGGTRINIRIPLSKEANVG